MSDVYYIIVVVVFCVFVLLMAWWIYSYMRKSNPLEMTNEELTDEQKEQLSKFCSEMKRARLEKEERERQAAEALVAASKESRKSRRRNK